MANLQLSDSILGPYFNELSGMLKPGPNDHYSISRYAAYITYAYVWYVKVLTTRTEARFRRHIDTLIELAFGHDPDGLVVRYARPKGTYTNVTECLQSRCTNKAPAA